jgi:uncharacterized membrane protein
MNWTLFNQVLVFIQRGISFLGILIILSGILYAIYQYICYFFTKQSHRQNSEVDTIRLNLGRILILGLEFIVAADLISTTTAPDYYTLGIVAIIVLIRTLLSYSISREIMGLTQQVSTPTLTTLNRNV